MAPHGSQTNGMRRADSVLNLAGNHYQTLLIARKIVGFFPISKRHFEKSYGFS
jgi:hypothetical protein